MKPFNPSSVSLSVKRGKETVSLPLSNCPGASVSFRTEEIDGGYACYVSAKTEEAFSAECAVSFTLPPSDTADYLAINNHSEYWCRPFWGNSLRELPTRVQELLIRDGDRYICYLPLLADTYKPLIRGTEHGAEVYLFSNFDGLTEISDQLAFVCMEDSDPMRLLRSIARAGARLIGNGLKMRDERVLPEVFRYFGWCSWDALQYHITHEAMLVKAREFKEKGVPVGFAIYDDMWGDAPLLSYLPEEHTRSELFRTMHASMLRSFEGDPVRFPKGMKAAIADLKREGIPYVCVWFPTTGYWSGLQPGGEIAEAMRDNLAFTEEKRHLVAAPEEEKADAYFRTLCTRVKEWGGDFVKIDNQSTHTTRYKNLAPIGKSARVIQGSINRVTNELFGGAVINCMGMTSECMFSRPDSAVSRSSDDFLPESRPWFAKNILQCSYNGLLQGQYYYNDWDMWWTDDEQAQKNSLCRAISGGPIYVSDKIGRTNPEILRPILLKDGRILLCDESATPTADCLFRNPTLSGTIFKIRNRIEDSAVAAVFNIDAENRAVSGALKPTDTGLPAGEYVYYEFFSGDCGVLGADASIDITLRDNDDFRLYTFIPKGERFTVIGRRDLFLGRKAVSSVEGSTVTLIEGGETLIYSDSPVSVSIGKTELPVQRDGKITAVTLEPESTEIELR